MYNIMAIKSCFSFGCAFLLGAVTLCIVLFVIGIGDTTDNTNQQTLQYVEVTGKKGTVTLHTDMPKDSVRMLLGKPSTVDLSSTAFGDFEDWGYRIRNKYIADLRLHFVDGKLKEVHQN
jgi:hypothetical protein